MCETTISQKQQNSLKIVQGRGNIMQLIQMDLQRPSLDFHLHGVQGRGG